MSSNLNNETQDVIKREIKQIQARCKNAWNIIDNSPLETPSVTLEEINEKTLCYIEGLRTEIQSSSTPITTDDNLLTSQFLKELKDKTIQIEEMTAYMKGCVHDTDTEISRLKKLIKTAEEAKSRPKANKPEILPEHIRRAKDRFQNMKQELHGLIHALFPNEASSVINFMGELMGEHTNETSNGYVPVTTENYKLIEMLKDLKIVTTNPYNNLEVKLAY